MAYKKHKTNFNGVLTKNVERDSLIVSLREKGYTYEAIAHSIFEAGYTKHKVTKVSIEKYIRKLAPHLCGCVKHKMKLEKLVRVKDLTDEQH